jgi:hypothetical protein
MYSTAVRSILLFGLFYSIGENGGVLMLSLTRNSGRPRLAAWRLRRCDIGAWYSIVLVNTTRGIEMMQKAGGGYRRVTASRYVMLSLLADNATSPPAQVVMRRWKTGYSMMMKERKDSVDDGLRRRRWSVLHQRWIAVLAASEAWGGV